MFHRSYDEKPSVTGIGHKSVFVEAKRAHATQADRPQEEGVSGLPVGLGILHELATYLLPGVVVPLGV